MTSASLPWQSKPAAPAAGLAAFRAGRLLARTALLALAVASVVVGAEERGAAELRARGQIVQTANEARAANGLARLATSPELTRAAQAFAERLAAGAVFSHRGDDGSTVVTRAEAGGYAGWWFLGEDLARGPGSVPPQEVVGRWLASPGHRENILSAEATDTGAGCAVASGHFWCVQLFGRRSP